MTLNQVSNQNPDNLLIYAEILGMKPHEDGYLWVDLTPGMAIEIMLICFLPGSSTKPHSHGASHSWNFILPWGKAAKKHLKN